MPSPWIWRGLLTERLNLTHESENMWSEGLMNTKSTSDFLAPCKPGNSWAVPVSPIITVEGERMFHIILISPSIKLQGQRWAKGRNAQRFLLAWLFGSGGGSWLMSSSPSSWGNLWTPARNQPVPSAGEEIAAVMGGKRDGTLSTLLTSLLCFCRYREVLCNHKGCRAIFRGLQTGGSGACLLLHSEHRGALHEPEPSWSRTQGCQSHCHHTGGEYLIKDGSSVNSKPTGILGLSKFWRVLFSVGGRGG